MFNYTSSPVHTGVKYILCNEHRFNPVGRQTLVEEEESLGNRLYSDSIDLSQQYVPLSGPQHQCLFEQLEFRLCPCKSKNYLKGTNPYWESATYIKEN